VLQRLGALQDLGHLRWTVDTADDFAFVRAVYDGLYAAKPAFDAADVLAFVRGRPELMRLGGEPRG
jgi:spore coat polysaccharide biosynthesis protein SpsF